MRGADHLYVKISHTNHPLIICISLNGHAIVAIPVIIVTSRIRYVAIGLKKIKGKPTCAQRNVIILGFEHDMNGRTSLHFPDHATK